MKLLVDLGNSAMKWAFLEQKRLGPLQSIPYQNNDFDNLLTQTWSKLDRPKEGVWISNVAGPQKASILTHWVEDHFGLKPIFIKTAGYECGVTNGYQNPQQLGVDRWLALIGAYHLEKGMLCVVDCGTAITLDVLSANGHHLGGLIMPGMTTMRNALNNNTYALSHFDNDLPLKEKSSLLAYDTHHGISLGTAYAVIGLLDYVINTLEKQGKVLILLTGGSAFFIEPFLQRPYRLIPDLVLQGLAVLVNQSL